jgi:hypothetical protein
MSIGRVLGDLTVRAWVVNGRQPAAAGDGCGGGGHDMGRDGSTNCHCDSRLRWCGGKDGGPLTVVFDTVPSLMSYGPTCLPVEA